MTELNLDKTIQKKLQESGWMEHLEPFFRSPTWPRLLQVMHEKFKAGEVILPRGIDIFKVFIDTPFDSVKAVILGPEPEADGSSLGLSLASAQGFKRSENLRRVLTEIERDCQVFVPEGYNLLDGWSAQGVLLLNDVLTVTLDYPGSHIGLGWEELTDMAIKAVHDNNIAAFIAWGDESKEKIINLISLTKRGGNLFAFSGRPGSPEFTGCKHFSRVNEFLSKRDLEEIQWQKTSKNDLKDSVFLPKWTKKDEDDERIRNKHASIEWKLD